MDDSTFAHFQLPTQTISHTLGWLYGQTEEKSVMPVTFRSNKTELPFGAAGPDPHAATREAAMAAFAKA